MKYALTAALVCSLCVAISLPAFADNYINDTINFSIINSIPTTLTPQGSFTYDLTNNSFSSFVVQWNGYTFDLTASANAPTTIGPASGTIGTTTTGCSGESTGGPTFGLLLITQQLAPCTGTSSGTGVTLPFYSWTTAFSATQEFFSFSDDPVGPADEIEAFVPIRAGDTSGAVGTWSVVATPEPSTIVLLGSGLLALMLTALREKRLA